MKRVSLWLLFMWMLPCSSFAAPCGVTPNPEIIKIVQRLAYPDFPTAADIFATIQTESSFNPKAVNWNEREHSIGLMQVQHGPFDPRLNIAMGVSLLREYFKMFHSREAAVKAYNIGPANYRKGKCKISAALYYSKFLLYRKVYAQFPKRPLDCNVVRVAFKHK